MSIVTIDTVRALIPNTDPRGITRFDAEYHTHVSWYAAQRWEGVLENPRFERKRLGQAIAGLELPEHWMRTPRAWYFSATEEEMWAEVHEQNTHSTALWYDTQYETEGSPTHTWLSHQSDLHSEWATLIRSVIYFRFRVRTA